MKKCHWSGLPLDTCKGNGTPVHTCVKRTPALVWCSVVDLSPQQLADIRACVEHVKYDVDEDPEDYARGAGDRLGAILTALPEADTPNSFYLRAEDRT